MSRQGAAGLVLIALGAGNAAPVVVDAVADAVAAGVHVLITSRVTAGSVASLSAGGGVELARVGAVFGDDPSPWQARLLLSAACALPGRHPPMSSGGG